MSKVRYDNLQGCPGASQGRELQIPAQNVFVQTRSDDGDLHEAVWKLVLWKG